MNREYPRDLEEAIRFHGHVCPGLVIGYRAAGVAQSRLRADRPRDEELVAIVETDACGVDAIQALLGCTLGKGNLIFQDHGKQVFTVICRNKNLAVRIAMKADAMDRPPEQEALMQRVRSGAATPEERKIFDDFQQKKIDELLETDEEILFKIEEVPVNQPEKARIFKSVLCHYCGEKVMEPRARFRNGQAACIPCAEDYSRGW
jgi:formylmethanofuran dehydrogenase subunit E